MGSLSGRNVAINLTIQPTLMNVSNKTISSWENERTYPDIGSLFLLSDILELSLDELLKGDMDMVRHLDKDLQEGRNWKKWRWAVGIALILVLGFILLNIVWVVRACPDRLKDD